MDIQAVKGCYFLTGLSVNLLIIDLVLKYDQPMLFVCPAAAKLTGITFCI